MFLISQHRYLRLWLLWLIILVIAAVSLLLYQRAHWQTSIKKTDRQQSVADFVIHAFQGLAYDQDGTLQYEIFADKLTQYPNAQTQLIKPTIVTYEKSSRVWHISADTGSINKYPQLITLENNVLLRGVDNLTLPVLSTEYLQLFPEQDLVITDHLVQINQASGKMQSTGLKGKIRSRELTLERAVSGHYDLPPKPKSSSTSG